MRKTVLVALILTLVACGASGQGDSGSADEQAARDSPQAAVQPTETQTPAPATVQPRKPTVPPTATEVAGLPVPTGLQGISAVVTVWSDSTKRRELRPVLAASGAPQPGREPRMLEEFTSSFAPSPDGRRLAGVTQSRRHCEPLMGGTGCWAVGSELHLIDLQSWNDITATLSTEAWYGPPVFNADGSRMALAYDAGDQHYGLILVDGRSGTTLAQRELSISAETISFRADATLAVYGAAQPDPLAGKRSAPQVMLLDGATLDLLWEQQLADVLDGQWCIEGCAEGHGQQLYMRWSPAVTFVPDGSRIYIVHADTDRLTTVDLQARTVQTAEIRTAESLAEQLLALVVSSAEAKSGNRGAARTAVLSPDGSRLYVAGRKFDAEQNTQGFWESRTEPLPLQAIDLASGAKLAEADLEAATTTISISPDGTRLYLSGVGGTMPWAELRDGSSLQRLARLDGWEVRQGSGEQPLLLAAGGNLHRSNFALVDPETFRLYQPWSIPGYAYWVAP